MPGEQMAERQRAVLALLAEGAVIRRLPDHRGEPSDRAAVYDADGRKLRACDWRTYQGLRQRGWVRDAGDGSLVLSFRGREALG